MEIQSNNTHQPSGASIYNSSRRPVTLSNGNRRSNFNCAVATTTGYFAARNAAGITEVYSACFDKDHKIPAYGRLELWSCAGSSNAASAGHITALVCPGNHLLAITVSGQRDLQHLDCGFNDLVSLDLSGLPALETLLVPKNRLASLDVRGLSRLKTLNCYGNLLTTLDLTGLERLEVLECSMNQLLSLKLGGCKSLHTLYAYRNQITELNLASLPALRDQDLSSNPLQSRHMKKFAVFHRDREYAREMGDPKLTEIEATCQQEAERLTAHLGLTGTVAVLLSPATHPSLVSLVTATPPKTADSVNWGTPNA